MDKNVMRSDIFLSIVIPVYNVEKYLARCLDSILKQQVEFSYEIIAVNDCSTDSSFSILLDYKKNYHNIILVDHKSNQKLSIARKSGIDLCKGNYIMHVDSDDWIEPNSLQYVHTIIAESLPDIVVFNYYIENSMKIRNSINNIHKSHIVCEKKEAHKYFLGAPWNKIVKRELLKEIVFGSEGINNGEDLVYSTELFFKAKNILLSNFSFYVYFNNLTSLTKVDNSFNFLSNQQIVLSQLSFIIKKYKPTFAEISFVINYFLNFIYLEIFKYNFKLNNEVKKSVLPILKNISSNDILSKQEKQKLNQSFNSKLIILFEIFKRFGIKKTVGLMIK
jgi:glycosyltransferase involved in cell wall biosynthesis